MISFYIITIISKRIEVFNLSLSIFLEHLKTFLDVLLYINIPLAMILIFLERRKISETLAWLTILLFLPGIGFILYITFGQNLSREKIFTLKKDEDSRFKDYYKKNKYVLDNNITFSDESLKSYKNLMYLHYNHSHAPFSENNDVTIYADGAEKFDALLREIKKANSSIHIAYYIMRKDELGTKLRDALVEKAKEGVEVKVLYDQLGSKSLPKKFWDPLIEAGGKYSIFFPSVLKFINFRINYRNHRKIVVIDNSVAFVGGFNVGDEYLGKNKKFGYWRDTHLKIRGESVYALQLRFLLDWRHASKEDFPIDTKYIKPLEKIGTVGMQIVSSGPDSEWEEIKYGYIKMIQDAKKSILIQTPYLVLDQSISEAIKIASLSGIDVKIMIPNKPDHPFIYWASYSNAGDLVKTGVKIYTYEAGFLHAKTMVVDESISSVGTANMDVRSFKLNFEVNAFIYDIKISKTLSNLFHEDMKKCKEITAEKYASRSIIIKIKESISRLLSPIL